MARTFTWNYEISKQDIILVLCLLTAGVLVLAVGYMYSSDAFYNHFDDVIRLLEENKYTRTGSLRNNPGTELSVTEKLEDFKVQVTDEIVYPLLVKQLFLSGGFLLFLIVIFIILQLRGERMVKMVFPASE